MASLNGVNIMRALGLRCDYTGLNMPMKGISTTSTLSEAPLIRSQKGSYPKDHHVDDPGQGRLGSISRCLKKYSNGRS